MFKRLKKGILFTREELTRRISREINARFMPIESNLIFKYGVLYSKKDLFSFYKTTSKVIIYRSSDKRITE